MAFFNQFKNFVVVKPQTQQRRIVTGSDQIALTAFHDSAFVVSSLAKPSEPKLQQLALQLHTKVSGSGTNITDGLRKSINLLRNSPRGVLKRIWLLSDGEPNRETESLFSILADARRNYINVNTIGFGDSFDENLLRRMAKATHNGRFFSVRNLRQLTAVLLADAKKNPIATRREHRAENTVLCIDCSISMHGAMENTTKIRVVEEATLQLLLYKQRLFS
ncbi:MAG TPA: vWA domain-containing protein [Pyrinomonadaceae bacterium]